MDSVVAGASGVREPPEPAGRFEAQGMPSESRKRGSSGDSFPLKEADTNPRNYRHALEACVNRNAVDEATFWLADSPLHGPGAETDKLVLEEIRSQSWDRPLSKVLAELDHQEGERAGEFGLEHAAMLVAPLVVPALYSFVKRFVAKFIEGVAGEAGKLTAGQLKETIAKALSGKLPKIPTSQVLLPRAQFSSFIFS